MTDEALDGAAKQLDAVGAAPAALVDVRSATEGAAPIITDGFLTKLISGVSTVIGLASGIILGALVMYYLLKDGNRFRRVAVGAFDPALRGDIDGFIGDACRTLRVYGRGRTIMSAIVAPRSTMTARPPPRVDLLKPPSCWWWCSPPTCCWRTSWSPG
jgi:hypothetical protein